MSPDNRIFNNVLTSYRDNQWLINNEQHIFETIQSDLHNADKINDTLKALLLIFPRMFELQSKEVKSWGKLVRLAFNRTFSQEDIFIFPNERDHGLGGVFVVQMRESPSQLPTKTKRKKREIVHPQAFYEMYLALLMMQFYENELSITPEIMQDMVLLARAVNDPYLTNKTYQTLAYIYNAQDNFEHGCTLAEKAWDFWVASPSPLESFLTAYALYIAHTGLGNAEQARYWGDMLSKIDDAEDELGHREVIAHLKARF